MARILLRRPEYKKYIYLILILFFSLKMFQSTPFESVFFQIQSIFIIAIFFFLIIFIMSNIAKRVSLDNQLLYFIFLIIAIPIYSAYRANVEFSQPILYGLLAERGWTNFAVGIWLYYAVVTEKITLRTLESTFVFMAWASLLIFTIFILTFDPSQLQSTEEFSKLVTLSESRGIRFKFQNYFIGFGALYYFISYYTKKKTLDFVFFLFFIFYIFFAIEGRTYILALGITFLIYLWISFSLERFILNMIKIIAFFFISVLLIQIFMPDYLSKMIDLFSQMFTVLSGNESDDVSANARIYASVTVLDYFNANHTSLWLGTGKVSSQWNEGYESLFGYFYPSDIGILGGIFMYGIIGAIFIFLIPLILSLKTIRSLGELTIFLLSIKLLLIFMLIRAVQGTFFHTPITYIIPLFILLGYIQLQRRKDATSVS